MSDDDENRNKGQRSEAAEVTIRADHLSKQYGAFMALHHVSFEVRRGTVAAFLGPNGAGKSTTMKILTGFVRASGGRAEVLGLDPGDAEQRLVLSRRLGYLPETGPLYPDMTPRELFEFVGRVRGLDARALSAAIDRVVQQCALAEVLEKPIGKLSKGYRQRVGMGQALLHDPDVLILDEPTSGLDPLQIREVRRLIRRLGESRTVLLSTHILQEVEAVADEVVMIAEGRVVFTGTVDELRGERGLEERFYALAGGAREEVA